MASIQMSQSLRDVILDNYHKQLKNTAFTESTIDKAVTLITKSLTGDDPNFSALCLLDQEWQRLTKMLNKTYPSKSGWRDMFEEKLLPSREDIGVVCNPNRSNTENFTYIYDWSSSYTWVTYGGTETHEEASTNWVKGDIGVELKDVPSYYSPVKTSMSYTNYRGSGNTIHAPHTNCALLVTDPEICKLLSPIGEIKEEIAINLQNFKQWLDTVTTVKKFVDSIPGAIDLIPEETITKMNTKSSKQIKNAPPPPNLIPEALKKQMNEVILENKLLGD